MIFVKQNLVTQSLLTPHSSFLTPTSLGKWKKKLYHEYGKVVELRSVIIGGLVHFRNINIHVASFTFWQTFLCCIISKSPDSQYVQSQQYTRQIKQIYKTLWYNCNFNIYLIFVGWTNDGREGWRLVIRCISETPTLSVACKCFVVSNTQLSQSIKPYQI